ncbi:hypothetical protein ABTY98_36100 [Streptomyces sp. NPDC096040]|uniref:hypothetical protein n=1 Tax=Streptomyces sp. NPDC096040 TaxID=3155541 RepID=UPI00331EA375
MTTIIKAASVPLLDRGGAVLSTPLITTPSAGGENLITSGMCLSGRLRRAVALAQLRRARDRPRG